ncbi:hypothetical protein L1049_004525 [Liquidambar formosana]|uniref:RIN4 pathogenic type III effector avirulence factor Avr cleavage site domain-containing protein n=1 Tax=Liquidambar formosana TaxID=63359 RepID=A0AAP0RNB1_LIQFO
MAQRSHVPKFGNWESEENVPYTAYFDKARKGRTGAKMINPNDPEENPDLFSDNSSPPRAPPSKTRAEPEEPIRRGALGPSDERRMSKEDGDLRQFADSPARHDNTGRRLSSDSTHQRPGGRVVSTAESHNRRPGRQSAGSEHSTERSPLHYQARVAGRASVGSPSWEGKVSSDSSHGTPGRSRMKPNTRADENPDKGAAVPKFGEWDENNPSSADGYTHIFNKVREERRTGEAKVPGMPTESSYGNNENTNDKVKICCFPWRGK